MTHKLSKTWILWLESTRLVIIIIIQNGGTWLEPESNIRPIIGPLFHPEYWPNIKYFLNSKAGSSYLPNFDHLVLKVYRKLWKIFKCSNIHHTTFLVCQNFVFLVEVWGPGGTMVSFPKNHANTKKFFAKLSSNKKKLFKNFLKLHPKITKSTFFGEKNLVFVHFYNIRKI